MRRLLLRWLLNALGLWVVIGVVRLLVPGSIEIETLWTPFLAIIVLGFINAFIRPIVKILALPLNCLTLGLFSIVINLLLFWLAFRLTPGFVIASPPEGVIAILLAWAGMIVVSMIVNHILRKDDD